MQDDSTQVDMKPIAKVISEWKLSQPILAEKIGMPVSTFKNKLNPNQPKYWFKDHEAQALVKALRALSFQVSINLPQQWVPTNQIQPSRKSKKLS